MKTGEHGNALIVIDMQYDFCSGGSLAVPGAEEIIEPINSYMEDFSCIVATQDWHPEGHVSFASSHPGKAAFETVPFNGDTQILWPDHCVAGSPGAAFHSRLETDRFSMIIRKGTNPGIDSYSGFYENDHTTSTGLAGYLRELGIEHLYLCGLAADVCVYFTAVDARKLGFKVTLLTDAARGIDTPPGSLEQRYAELNALDVTLK
jgi:nicotinamidase/pyrazinamidase